MHICGSTYGEAHVVLPCVSWPRGTQDEKVAVGPWLLALFIFVVCGSGEFFQTVGHILILQMSPLRSLILSTCTVLNIVS
uniref:Stress-associated endoplasmic reticulum protein n=1 Tax=Gadus morhua TaxID=8049 RepID=A0A8C5FHH8_GADMO